MKTSLRSIRKCMERAIFSWRFLAATAMTAVLLILDLFPTFWSGIYAVDGKTKFAYDLLSLSEFSGFTMFLGFSFITAVLPYSGSFCDDYQHSFLIPFVKKNSMIGYSVGTTVACGVSSFLCVLLAQTLCLGFYSLFIPVTGENFRAENYMYSLVVGGHQYLFLFAETALYSLRGAFFGLMSLLISSLVKNKFVVYAVPFILYYFLMKFGYSILNVPSSLNILGIYFSFAYGPQYELKSLVYALVITLIVGLITGMAVCRSVRRCI